MIKYLYIIGFILVFILGDRLFATILVKVVDGSNFRYSRLYNNKAKSDLLFIGNSRGLVYYQPTIENITNKKTLNLSYNGLPTKVALVLLEDYFKLYPPPEVVFIEATMRSSRPELVENFKTYMHYSDNLQSLIKKDFPEVSFITDLSNLYKYNSEIFQRALYFYAKSDTTWLNNRTISLERIEKEKNLLDTITIDHNAVEDFLKMKYICETNGSRIVFLINPYLPDYLQRLSLFDRYLQYLRYHLGDQLFDYSMSINEIDYFADNVHLNKLGSKKYIKMLSESGIFNKSLIEN